MRSIVTLLMIIGACAAVGCGKDEPAETPEEKAQKLVRQTLDATSSTQAGSGPMVEVAADGTRFDPPVQGDQLPPGTWYCDLGTVHYARRDRGSGTCPECGMTLTQRTALPTGAQ